MDKRKLTPLALAIEEIKELQSNENIGSFTKRAYAVCMDVLESLKPKERQMLESAYNGAIKARYTNGMIDLKLVKIDRLPETFELYYNANLTQE